MNAALAKWAAHGLCAQTDPDEFFPDKGGSVATAKRLCLGCEVRQDCLDYALATGEQHGIWGGTTVRERQRLTAQPLGGAA
ncbi:WhiB family transcriptional regulator [Streptomyces sp. NPDC090054]|uniref:WhiB family transcriptional regulator n=1 Tax=Streptomyces sp. NPDC090054 TaxID=3365933 RepID=UPI00382A1DBA